MEVTSTGRAGEVKSKSESRPPPPVRNQAPRLAALVDRPFPSHSFLDGKLTLPKRVDTFARLKPDSNMLDVIEKILVLQDRDRKIIHAREELAHVAPERAELLGRASGTKARLDAAKLAQKQIESDRKKLELDVEAKQQQINKYANQQLQTKKNEEYKALANEIENCKKVILGLEDQELELMEKAETAQKDAATAQLAASEAKKLVDGKVADLDAREKNLQVELVKLESNRAELAAVIDDSARDKYERLLKSKGGNAAVGISHHSCGGCHMKLSRGLVVACQAHQEIVTCSNCGRILFFTPDMDLAIAD